MGWTPEDTVRHGLEMHRASIRLRQGYGPEVPCLLEIVDRGISERYNVEESECSNYRSYALNMINLQLNWEGGRDHNSRKHGIEQWMS